MSLRQSVTLELVALGVLTTLFLSLFPSRPLLVDVALALMALVLLTVNARFTKHVIWHQFPVSGTTQARLRACLLRAGLMTLGGVVACLGIGIGMREGENGWRFAAAPLTNGHLLIAMLVYFPWALVQQTLLQFYLLGRLCTLLPREIAIIVTGCAYALVHLPEVGVTVGTAAAGIWWTSLYLRYRCLIPLALSHAVLGATWYYWVYGHDLIAAWRHLAF